MIGMRIGRSWASLMARTTRGGQRKAGAIVCAGLLAGGGCAAFITSTAGAASSATPAADCQPFAAAPCLLPFPNNLFTVPDKTSATGLRVHLPALAMPVNNKGVRVGVAPFDRNDGFSPGSAMIVHVPGLDNPTAFTKTGAVGLLKMANSFVKTAPIVVVDEATGQRQLIYSELDSNAPNPADTNLMIIPGKALTDGHTYVVALRGLRNSSGQVIPAPTWFEKLRDSKPLPAKEQSQKSRYAKIFAALSKAGITRSNLYEAWDYTVASRQDLTGRLLAIRNNAFHQLGDNNLADGIPQGNAPAFSVSSDTALNGQITKIVGTFQVPCYLITCGPSATTAFHYSSTTAPDATPTQTPGNIATAQFECLLPDAATHADPARVALYGHGLLGDMSEVESGWVTALITGDNMAFCATNWWGLAQESKNQGDTPLAVEASQNLNLFSALVDRLQQGVLNTLFLGRLLRSPAGFATNAHFQSAGQPVIDTSHLYYYGDSQGGIEGGLTTAVAPDWTNAVLGVTGIDYGNMLIQRSVDFTPFKQLLNAGYPDLSLYPVITDLMQQLWDRGDPDGYAAYMTSHPLPDTPAHKVLMQIAYGDFQVSMYAGAAEARTIGASVVEPVLSPDRLPRDANLFYGLPAVQHYPFNGSAVEIWDSGPTRTMAPPVGNIPPTANDPGPSTHPPYNVDPHEDPRNTPAAQTQISAFLEPNGAVTSVCNDQPCRSSDYNMP